MDYQKTGRGFEVVMHDSYSNEPEPMRLVQQSSAIRDYPDALQRPGSSCLWIGDNHHLNREEAAELMNRIATWLATGSLRISSDVTDETK